MKDHFRRAICLALILLVPPGAALAEDAAGVSPAAGAAPSAAGEEEIETIEEVETLQPDGDGSSSNARDWFSDAYPSLERGINLHLARTVRKYTLLFSVDHRTYQPLTKNPFEDFLGFDSGNLKIGLGLRFGVLDWMDVGLYRLNDGKTVPFDTYEFDAKFRVLKQDGQFLNLAVRPGVTLFTQRKGVKDSVGFFGQLLLDRVWFNRLTTGTGLLFHSNSTNDVKSNLDERWSMAVPFVFEYRILDWLALNYEMAVAVAGYGSKYGQGGLKAPFVFDGSPVSTFSPIYSGGVKFITNRHTFAIVVSNNQFMTADGVVANTWRCYGESVIGFSITRELDFD
ncbi:MAG: hypothetical protein GMKNLPBB_00306 [Myxococcota bacterium]|nr:hypothetical protein [Myxococcota bacterium]